MHYNQFTIDYIEAIKNHLKIEIDDDGKAVCFPDIINDEDIINLQSSLNLIWQNSQQAISLIKEKKDATIQSGLFGLVNDLDAALKIGFLISDRIVLVDYLYERILLKKAPNKVDRQHLGVLASSLVGMLPLVKTGRIVIIPSPFYWNSETKQIIKEVEKKTVLTPELMSLLNMLSITKICNLHPFTIAESESNYSAIIENQINYVDVIGMDPARYAFEGILAALLSEKLLMQSELKVVLSIPLNKYFEIISSSKDFYVKYLKCITSGGSFDSTNNINRLREILIEEIQLRNKELLQTSAKTIAITAGLGGGAIALLSAITVISAPITITGAILALSGTLAGAINYGKMEEQAVINVFKKMHDYSS